MAQMCDRVADDLGVGYPSMRTFRQPLLILAALFSLGTVTRALAQQPRQAPVKVPAPEFPGGLKWLNSEPLRIDQLRGKVVLVDFWEYTCVNCIRTLPYLKAWHEKYKDKGLVIIGVHTPEFAFAKQEANVARSVKEFGLTYPIVVDSDYAVWKTYGNQFWPAKYLIDAAGNVRYFHPGEGSYEATEERIQALLKEANPNLKIPSVTGAMRAMDKPGAVCYPMTPELYVGYERGGSEGTLANPEGYHPGKVVTYKDRGKWEDGHIQVNGAWKNLGEALVSTRPNPTPRDYIGLKYHALEVNTVLKPEEGKPVKIWILHDNKPVDPKDKGADIRYDAQGRSYILLDQPRMYHLVKNAEYGQRTLKLAPSDPGMGIYSFTFVSCTVPKK
jgi:thiol-disulfide isomerase/thioredoxin